LRDLLDEAHDRALKLVTEKNPDLPEAQRRAIAEAVGLGAIKYADLSKDRTSDYIFSFDSMLSLDGNTAPYLQYAYARIKSIFRKAVERGIAYDQGAALMLESPFELALAKHVLRLGEIVALVARELKPHHLTTYLYAIQWFLRELPGAAERRANAFESARPVRRHRQDTCTGTRVAGH
jgi:arginyl-tRNA synthetase